MINRGSLLRPLNPKYKDFLFVNSYKYWWWFFEGILMMMMMVL